MYLEVMVESFTESMGGYDPENEWSRDSTETTNRVLSAHLKKDQSYHSMPMDFKVDKGDDVFIVWAEYTTGDSFGRDGGNVELVLAFESYDKAEMCEKKIKEHYNNGDSYTLDLKSSSGKDISFFVPWKGYFESLDCVNIDKIMVQ